VLFVKCRLGDPGEHWRQLLTERLRLFERCRVDCLVVHPRFSDEKLKRRARWEELEWVARQTAIPLVGNGDIDSPARLALLRTRHPAVRAWMLGRIAAVRPWIFAECAGLAPVVDPAEVWSRLKRYIDEDFEEPRRLGRIKEFTEFYSRNFAYGHDLFRTVQSSVSTEQAESRATAFFSTPRELLSVPSIASL
jgi:tRNA-dihydrouridine synthase